MQEREGSPEQNRFGSVGPRRAAFQLNQTLKLPYALFRQDFGRIMRRSDRMHLGVSRGNGLPTRPCRKAGRTKAFPCRRMRLQRHLPSGRHVALTAKPRLQRFKRHPGPQIGWTDCLEIRQDAFGALQRPNRQQTLVALSRKREKRLEGSFGNFFERFLGPRFHRFRSTPHCNKNTAGRLKTNRMCTNYKYARKLP